MTKMKVGRWVCVIVVFLGVNVKAQAQSWSFTGSMETQRAFFTTTVLENGEVLVAGGRNRGQHGLTTAELYNSNSGTLSPTGNLNTGRANFRATLLNDGTVLVAGGDAYIFMPSGTVHICFSSAELYHPATGKFKLTGSMHSERCSYLTPGFTATLLANGQVLIAGGADTNGLIPTAELYDPSSGTFSLTGSLNTPRLGHTATLLGNGEVLIAGGSTLQEIT